MRRIVIALCSTVTGLVLLLSWPTSLNRTTTTASGSTDSTGTGTTTSGTTGSTGTTDSSGTTSGTTTTGGTTAGTTSGTTTTYNGDTASTRYGDVQVRITVTDGVLTAAEAIAYPDQDGHSARINQHAVPVLNKAATAARSANISMVTGATYTSNGYIQSLQSALDQAGL